MSSADFSADWLEERGDPRGEYLRLELAPVIDENWLETVARRYDVQLREPGPNKIAVIKEVRAITGRGLKDAKDIVDGAGEHKPYTVVKRLDRDAADRVAQQLASPRGSSGRRSRFEPSVPSTRSTRSSSCVK